VSDFILEGYYDFNAALKAVGKHLFNDAWDWREPEAPATPSVEDYIFGKVTNAAAIRRIATPEETAGPSDPVQLSDVLNWLHQRLFDTRLPSEVLTETLGLISIPHTEWGPEKWDEVVASGKIEFVSETINLGAGYIPLTVSGRVMFRIKDFEKEFLPPGPATGKAEVDCRVWLRKVAKEPKDKPKMDYFLEARSAIGKSLSRDAFDRAWAVTVPEKWKRKGRPR